MRKSSDWGKTWEPSVTQPFPPPSLPKVVYDPKENALVSMGYCEQGPGLLRGGCPEPATCSWKSTDEGQTWTGPIHVGDFGSGEGCIGATLSTTGNLLMPTGLKCNGTVPEERGSGADTVLISSDHGATWKTGGLTPILPTKQSWGESGVAELANGSVVITSRLGGLPGARKWSMAAIQRGFAMSHDGGETWDRAWTFPAGQGFDTGFGPSFNVEHGILSANEKTKLLLSKPTATLRGDSTGKPPACDRGTQGSCAYRRNLTIAESGDGGASWSIGPWGLIYGGRIAYSSMAELPGGKVAVVFERGTPLHEYRYLSVAIATPPWAKWGCP